MRESAPAPSLLALLPSLCQFRPFHWLKLFSLCLVRFIKEELMRLQEPGSNVGEVVKLMGKKKALVKVAAAPRMNKWN